MRSLRCTPVQIFSSFSWLLHSLSKRMLPWIRTSEREAGAQLVMLMSRKTKELEISAALPAVMHVMQC